MQPLPTIDKIYFTIKRSTVLHVILIILILVTSAHAISKLPEDGAEAPKHVGAFCNNNLIF
jgi:hypothetical protein